MEKRIEVRRGARSGPVPRFADTSSAWKSLFGFDPGDTYAVLAVIQQANAFIAAQREEMPNE